MTNALNQTTTLGYNLNTGRAQYSIDPNNARTDYAYVDPLDRLTQMVQAGVQTNYQYPNPTTVIRYQDQNQGGDKALQTQTIYDGLGRVSEQRTYENASSYITTVTNYDALNRVASTSNPSQPPNAVAWTYYSYDALGRTTQTQEPDGSVVNTSYSGALTTVTDEAGKQKRYQYDGLGRLFAVYEDPAGLNYATNYRYNALDNLTLVSQGNCPNCQNRSFTYDAMSRQTSAVNPESGSTTYGYDAASNLTSKTDARGFTSTYAYDGLNRLTQKSYNDTSVPGYTTPTVQYAYDDGNVPNSIGRLTQIHSAVSTTSYLAYDPLGRVTASQQSTSGQFYNFSYGYNLAGALTSEIYPSGRAISTGYDGANRANTVSGTLNGQPVASYLTSARYWPYGALSFSTYGNNVLSEHFYNNRLQPSAIYWDSNTSSGWLYDEELDWGSNNNNGTVQSLAMTASNADGSVQQNFSYDNVNRLTGISEPNGFARSFSYDAWGNQSVTGASGINPSPLTPYAANGYNPYDAANRLKSAQYDAAGNQLQIGGVQLQYDAENRQLTSYDNSSQRGVTYVYDGQGQRVAKLYTDGSRRVYVYDALGQLAAEYQTNPASAPPCQTCYLSYDHLGSVRLVTDRAAQVVSRHDYLPFGEEIYAGQAGRDGSYGAADSLAQRFTGQERDGETVPNLDYFSARYYSGEQGRFLSVDPSNAGADLFHPQSWNAYAYVLNNPLAYTDPSGTDICADGSYADACVVDSPDPVSVDNCWYCYSGGGGNSNNQQSPPPPPVQNVLNVIGNWLTAPRDLNCVQQTAVAGAAAGAAGGAIVGGVGGGAVGGTLGSVVPVAGNLLGAAGGGELGLTGGAAIGGGLGYLGGLAGGYLTCASSTGGGGGGGGPQKFDPRNPEHRNSTGDQIISRFKKGSIRSVFPSQMLDKTFNEIEAEARSGNDIAQTARKLLTDSRFNK